MRGASIGNLILAGGYLNQNKQLDPIIFLVSKLVGVRGIVRAVSDANLYLGADLADGSTVIGQHLITGKAHAPLQSPINRLFLNQPGEACAPAIATFSADSRRIVDAADRICFPPGSFYSSVLANLLPRDVGTAISRRRVPKVYLPSLGHDPEAPNLGTGEKVDILLETLRADAGRDCPIDQLLDLVILDSASNNAAASEIQALEWRGVQAVSMDLSGGGPQPLYDPDRVCEVLVSLT